MKRPKPKAPIDAPEGTILFGGPIGWFSIALIINTEAVSIERLSDLLRCRPTDYWQKGVPLYRPDGTVKRIPKFSNWRLKLSPKETDEWDTCEAAKLLLARVNGDPEVWREITNDGKARLSFGLEMAERNLGFSLDPELMRYLGERNIKAGFDIYTDDFDLPMPPPSKRSEPTSH
jgi:Domain of unknown function (DUF4279)